MALKLTLDDLRVESFATTEETHSHTGVHALCDGCTCGDCTACTDCSGCTDCTNCTECSICTECTNCTYTHCGGDGRTCDAWTCWMSMY